MTAAPTLEQVAPFHVAGLSVRTCNSDEMNPATARLGDLWGRFFNQSWERSVPGRGDDGRVFGVYSAYEFNQHGAFDVTAGVATSPARALAAGVAQVTVQGGPYLVFRCEGTMPQMVIDGWVRVWQHFAAAPAHRRRFGTDFEQYEGLDQVAIYIGVLPASEASADATGTSVTTAAA
ncbi:GyrI-like domain-containing protein [Acidovorax sp. RAC01]|uniref:GyrI-like domain-containing protein n=1 Tax=Acidovorax sp. RAC01 TaxID=1842533 RepID=UPI00083E8D08|nr:GyrI-like domain-containing protein [Acidovorax sp. RAC01]AOG21542.1 integron cassette protein VCH CASS2 [Acidovorax sp. RAC01]